MFEFVIAVVQSALHRQESRGGHYYSDFPKVSDAIYHSSIQMNKEVLHVSSLSSESVDVNLI